MVFFSCNSYNKPEINNIETDGESLIIVSFLTFEKNYFESKNNFHIKYYTVGKNYIYKGAV